MQRYFRTALTEGQALITAVRVEHTGMFNLSTSAEHWAAFTSRQRVVTRGPAFLWDARIATVVPGLTVRVLDGYVCGEGILRAAVLGLFELAPAKWTPRGLLFLTLWRKYEGRTGSEIHG